MKYHLLNDGYETVPWALQEKFEAAGGELEAGTWVAGFDKTTLADGFTGVIVHFRGDKPPVTARAIVLAMPQTIARSDAARRPGARFRPSRRT